MHLLTIISFIIPAIFDLIFTLLGQPQVYWRNYGAVAEGSPGGLFLLSIHPLAFIGVFAVYLLLVSLVLKKWKNSYTYILGIALFAGHAWGSSSWIPLLFHSSSWYCMIGYFIFVSIPLGIALHRESLHSY